jgi:hypothetical protein
MASIWQLSAPDWWASTTYLVPSPRKNPANRRDGPKRTWSASSSGSRQPSPAAVGATVAVPDGDELSVDVAVSSATGGAAGELSAPHPAVSTTTRSGNASRLSTRPSSQGERAAYRPGLGRRAQPAARVSSGSRATAKNSRER